MRRIVAGIALALAGVLVPQAALAATGPTIGGDVSRYQCEDLPLLGDFVVVAVNTGVGTETNPCLGAQLAWAAGATGLGHSRVDVYLASANPAPAKASWWPTRDRTRAKATVHSPYGACKGGATRACSWVYGYSIARDDLTRGVTGPIGRWWIDVEQENSWSPSTTRNRASVEGMAAALTGAGKRVGLYAQAARFTDIVGSVPTSSRLSTLPSWIALTGDEGSARSRCSGTPLTTGRIELTQWAVGHVDQDLACGTLSSAKATTSGTRRSGHRLTARTGTWGPGRVHLAYRWLRDGKAIAGATHRTYVLKKKDVHHRITVRITGTETGYSRTIRTAASHRIAR